MVNVNPKPPPYVDDSPLIRSHKHEVYTEEVNKVALSGDDDKWIVMEDRIRTLAYGHFRQTAVSGEWKKFGRLRQTAVSGRQAAGQRGSERFFKNESEWEREFFNNLIQNCEAGRGYKTNNGSLTNS